MSETRRVQKTITWRRIVLLAGAGLALGAIVVTVADAIPRPYDVVIRVGELPPGDRLRAVITTTSDRAVVFEAHESSSSLSSGTLRYDLWLEPVVHELELESRSCPRLRRSFDPRNSDRFSLTYTCSNDER